MKNKWYILLFIVLIAISLFAFQYVAELLSDAPRSLSLETQYLLNLPACIFVGIVDFLIIVIVHKRLDNINNGRSQQSPQMQAGKLSRYCVSKLKLRGRQKSSATYWNANKRNCNEAL
ncbi:MAG: hypothetical protein ACLVEU_05560 [Bacteroides cellulosilyticus]